MALHFMDLSQAEPFVGSAGSSRGFQKHLEASIVDIHTVQKVYSGAYGGHFGYCRRFCVADGEREPLAPLGCSIYSIALCGSFPGRSDLSVLPDLLEASRSF